MLDSHILSAVLDNRATYEQIKEHVSAKEFSPGVAFWYGTASEYYARDPAAQRIDRDTLAELGKQKLTNPKHVEPMLAVLSQLPSAVSGPNVSAMVLDLRRFNLAAEFASSAMSGDRSKANKLFALLSEIWEQTELRKASEVEYAKDWSDLEGVIGASKRVTLGIPSLDARIGGGALPGHHILIFGRTEIGKSCLVLAIAANLLKTGSHVLYVGNEDNINIQKARLGQSLLGWTAEDMEKRPKKAARLLSELVQDRLTMVHMNPGSISELDQLLDASTASVLILDQIRNLSGSEEAMTQRLEANAIKFRSLLSKRHLVGISVTQAGDRSQRHGEDGPIFLGAGDVDSSRVGLPAQVDLMLGIGANREMITRGQRMLSFAKNKLASGPNSREPLLVNFDFQRNRVTDGTT